MRGSRIRALVLFCSALIASAAQAQRDNLLCYKARAAKYACAEGAPNAGTICADDSQCGAVEDACAKLPKLPSGTVARLDDLDPGSAGEDKTFNVKKVKQVCVPIDDQGRGIADADTHYLSYGIKQEKKVCAAGTNQHMPCGDDGDCDGDTCVEVPKFDRENADNINLYVEDQFANIRLDANKVDLLLSPATRCDGGNDAGCLGTAAPAGEETYKCYKAKATKKVCTPGAVNELQVCNDDSNCGGGVGSCVKLDKLAKGQTTSATDDSGTVVVADPNDPNSPDRTFDLKSLTHMCKATETTALPGGTPAGPVDSRARLLCYKSKASKAHCLPTAPANALGACSKEVDCGGVNDVTAFCADQVKFSGDDPALQGLYLNDQFDLLPGSAPTAQGDFHRLGLGKEQTICVPACEDPDEAIQFTPQVFRINSLILPPTGHPGDGIDLDMNPATCGPGPSLAIPTCSGGIDNWLGILAQLFDVNGSIADAVSGGDIHILLEVDDFADGAQVLNGYQGELASPSGCTNVNAGAQVCNYTVSGLGLDARTCEKAADIRLPVTVAGAAGVTPATVDGGGPMSSFNLVVPVLATELTLSVRNLVVQSSVVHSGPAVETLTGILGGAIIHQQLKQTINSLPEGLCEGGTNDGEPCTLAGGVADCPDSGVGTACNTNYLGGIPLSVITGVLDGLPRDMNTDGLQTCEGGTNGGEPCDLPTDCPDLTTTAAPGPVACDPNDGTSIALKFSAIDAAITGYETECNLATCSLE